MEELNILLGYSLCHPTKLNSMKYPEKLSDRGSRPGAKYLAKLLALKEYGILVSNLFLQNVSSISC